MALDRLTAAAWLCSGSPWPVSPHPEALREPRKPVARSGDGIALILAATRPAGLRMSKTLQRNTGYDRNQRREWPHWHAARRSETIPLAMRHVSALQSAPVGGDWCDVFVEADGHTLVIGDVCGHDATAARVMIRLRCLVR
jgi:hypothetical protein